MVAFSAAMVEAEVEDPANWWVESPIGTPFDLTGAALDYDPATWTATVTLGPGTVGSVQNGSNLQTFDEIAATFAHMRGANGETIVPTVIGVDAVSGVVSGDDRPPSILLAHAVGASTTLEVCFSEPCREVLAGELYVGFPGDPGPRFILTDADLVPAVAATGQVELLVQPHDGDTVVIDDSVSTVTFEFDSDSSVVQTPTLRQVVIGGSRSGARSLTDAINDPTLGFRITAVQRNNAVELTHQIAGVVGNAPITKSSDRVAVTGMQGGAEAVPGPIQPNAGNYAWAADGLGVTLDYGPSVPSTVGDTLEIYGVRDLAGNHALAIAALPIEPDDVGEPAIDHAGSSLTVVPGEENDVIVVHFAAPMSPYGLLLPSSYAAPPLDLSQASFSFDGVDEVTIMLDGSNGQDIQAGGSHDLALVVDPLTPMTTAQGVQLTVDDVEMLAAGGDLTPIMGATAYVGDPGHPSTCVLVFPESVRRGWATTVTHYAIAGAKPTAVSFLTARSLRLTFTAAPVAGDVLDVQPAAATDLGGNVPAGVLHVTLDPWDATPPSASLTAVAVSGVGDDLVSITFNEPVDPGPALQSASYSLEMDGVPLELTGTLLRYDSMSDTVTLELPSTIDLEFGADLTATIAGVTDLSGNPLVVQPASTIVGGDGTPPAIVGAFVNWIHDGAGITVDVFFDEAVAPAFVETPGSWNASHGTPVLSVQLMAPDLARVTTSTQLAPDETLEISGLPDLAGNAAGILAVDPLE